MARVSTEIALDGGKSFAQALKDIANQAKLMDSEMRKAVSAVDREADAEKKAQGQTEALTDRIKAQREIVDRLRAVMEDAAKQTGESSQQTQKARIAYNDAVTSLNNLEGELKDVTAEASNNSKVTTENTKAQKSWSESFKKVASGIGTAAKAIASATAAITAAAVAAGKAIFDMANDVAATGDEIDKMSQKIGISAQAYQEWSYVFERSGADVNNLQAGMKTLSGVIADAGNGASSAAEKLAAVGLSVEDLNGLSQEEQLGLVIQSLQEMGSGAERTAAATDLLGKSATDMAAVLNMTADETQALKDEANEYGMVMSDDAVKASAAFADSLTRLKGTISGVKNSMTGEMLPAITELMDGFSMLVSGQDGATQKIASGTSSIVTAITTMIPEIVNLIGVMGQAILQAAPTLILNLANGIIENLPTLVTTAVEVILTLVNALLSGESLTLLLDGAVQIVTNLAQGLIDNLPTILSAAMDLIGSLLDGLANGIPQLISMAVDLVFAVLSGLTNPGSLSNMIRGALKLVLELAKGLVAAIPEITARLPEIITNIVSTLIEMAPEMIVAAVEIAAQLIVGLIAAIPQIIKVIPDIINRMKEKFTGFDWASLGRNIMDGIKNGVVNAAKNLAQTVANAAKNLLDSAKRALGIHSPSKEFEKVGNFIGLGLDEGMTRSLNRAAHNMERELAAMPMQASATLTAATAGGSTTTTNYGGVSINVYAQDGQDAREIAREVEKIFMADLRTKEAAFA